jgi:acyl-CoA reductase-like NAD-dependent aldehyde dehydrogenase
MPDVPVTTRTCRLSIGGALVDGVDGSWTTVGRAAGHARVAMATAADLSAAVVAAQTAAERWATLPPPERGRALHRLAELIESRHDDLVAVISSAPRTPAARASKEVDAALARLVCFAGWSDKLEPVLGGPPHGDAAHRVERIGAPAGVVALLPPSAPELLGVVSLAAPALCAGNAVVVVTDPRQPVAGAILGEACAASDLPGGVVNVVTGPRSDMVDALAGDARLDAIAAANLPPAQTTALRQGAILHDVPVDVQRITGDAWYDTDERHAPATVEPFLRWTTVRRSSSLR